MTTTEKCEKPATAAIKVGKMAEFAPVCDEHTAKNRQRSAKAGKKALPKGLNKTQTAAFVGANQDDEVPVLVRALNEFEKASAPTCLNHLIPEGE